jgi:hypothetical protein
MRLAMISEDTAYREAVIEEVARLMHRSEIDVEAALESTGSH